MLVIVNPSTFNIVDKIEVYKELGKAALSEAVFPNEVEYANLIFLGSSISGLGVQHFHHYDMRPISLNNYYLSFQNILIMWKC